MTRNTLPHDSNEYKIWVSDLKQRFNSTQIKAAVAVNTNLLTFYWQLGQEIIERQSKSQWGEGLLKQLSKDLMTEFPDMKGFSYRNLRYIRQWTEFWLSCSQEHSNWQQLVANLTAIPWGHNLAILTKAQSTAEAEFYTQQTLKHGWSRAVLVHQIESKLWQRDGQALSNFAQTLPTPQSELAQQTLKDPYLFDFLTLTTQHTERDLELSLIQHITQFLLELGAGFAYMGRQVPLEVGNKDFFIDLLFYHVNLQCYVVIELKTTSFEPEHAGKLNFYIKAVDELLKKPSDNATIGLLLCKEKDQVIAEWALSDINKPIGISEYQLTQELPAELQSKLPTIAQIEAELEADVKQQRGNDNNEKGT